MGYWRRAIGLEDRALTPPTEPAGGTTYFEPPTVTRATPHNALSIADAFACVRALADAASSLPLIVYRRRNTGRTRQLTGLLPRLISQPAPGATQAFLVGGLMAHLNLYGNAYIGKFRERDEITQLALIHPDLIVPEIENGEPVYSYNPRFGERRQRLTTRDVIHVRGLSTDGLNGLSPVRQARGILELSSQLAGHAGTFFTNDATPRGILKLQRFGDVDAQVEALRDAWDVSHRGLDNAHKVAVVAGDVDFEQLGMPLDDAQFLEQRKLSAVEVARIFRVPPWMIGAESGDSMTYANVESQSLAFAQYALRPWLVAIEQAISNDPDLAAGNLYVEFLLDALLRADSKTRAEVYTRALDPITGWMDRAEVRERENLEPESSPPLRPAIAAAELAVPAGANGNGNGAGG